MVVLYFYIKTILGHIRAKFLFGEVGKNSYCINPCRIIGGKNIFIGNNVSILDAIRIETIEKFRNKTFYPKIQVMDGVNIEQNVHITCASSIIIEKNSSILANVLITDIIHPYEDIMKAPKYQEIIAKPVLIGENSMIGMGASILPGVEIGQHCVVGTNSVVTRSIPDYCVVAGVPARIIKKYNFETREWETV